MQIYHLVENFENIMEIRKTCPQDVPQILEFIKGIARYEKMENEVIATESKLHEWLFEKQVAQVVFAEVEGKAVGFALFFHNFSTFVGKAGIYLEDLYVMPEYRGKGYGKALFLHLVNTALELGCGRMEWVCLNWNTPSIEFYKSMGAISLDEWKTYRLTQEALQALAGKE